MFSATLHRAFIESQLREDRAHEDVTVRLLGARAGAECQAWVRSRGPGIFAGETICSSFQEIFQGEVAFETLVRDGDPINAGDTLVVLQGPVGICLSLERTLLNFLGHLSGVASHTQAFVAAVKPHPVKILATRKTLPGLRELQLEAVRAGGGYVHRRSLADGILIKDNHLAIRTAEELLLAAAEKSPLHGVEIEVQSLDLLDPVLKHAPTVIMLDNLSPSDVKVAVRKIGGRCKVEVSGGITLANVRDYAGYGIDYISVGALTHSSPSLNLTLDIEGL